MTRRVHLRLGSLAITVEETDEQGPPSFDAETTADAIEELSGIKPTLARTTPRTEPARKVASKR